MSSYQILARKYRPQKWSDVVGQDPTVTTLRNAIQFDRLAHAYLFCGSRGTGKTSIARIFAKALNCPTPSSEGEPCNACSSCKEITQSHSLDVLEIDGASHRGIDDIRQINETVGYAAASGRYKVYIIDEVHMLTKEAFNALLKTLEEPPEKVKFLFATTEPHKVLPTIVSRCQRFYLNRITFEDIVRTLTQICQDLSVDVAPEALHMIATMADGGLRDAESILDQLMAFCKGTISEQTVADILAIMPRQRLFAFDEAIKEGRYAAAFELAEEVFSKGKDLAHFVDTLLEHFRFHLLVKLSGQHPLKLDLAASDLEKYRQHAPLYSQEQLLSTIDHLVESQQQLRFFPNQRIGLENILLKVMRIAQRVPVEFLVRKLAELEHSLSSLDAPPPPPSPELTGVQQSLALEAPEEEKKKPLKTPPPQRVTPPPAPPEKKAKTPAPPEKSAPPPRPKAKTPQSAEEKKASKRRQNQFETMMQFAKVELGGKIEKKGPTTF